ncbi:MAG TPA: alpha/beta fold hydrolase [Ferruginibacter sp.]|nr:alpha/beta fold hydrolase [Ferruginibacter sp.]
MLENEIEIICSDGHVMKIYSWLPNTQPVCILHIAHGLAEHAQRYKSIAAFFAEHGMAVFVHNQRAHGKSVTPIDLLGITEPNWFYQQINDINLCISHHRQHFPDTPIFLLGHSMGSFLAQRYFQMHGNCINGLMLSATNGKEDPLMGFGIFIANLQRKLFGEKYRSKLIDYLSFVQYNKKFKPNRTKADWLSRDEAQVDEYVADEYCGFVSSASFYYYFFKGIKDAFRKENISGIPKTIPVYAFSGDKDPVGMEGKGFMELIKKWKAAGVNDFSYHLYKDGRHEMMNEINRDEVLENLLGFIKAHL